MHITVKQSGGMTGETMLLADLDTDRLSSAAAQHVRQVINGKRFFSLPADASGAVVGADLPRYEIAVRDGSRHHTVAFLDDGSPEVANLRDLVQELSKTA